jgi:hypothetical protein
LHANSVSPSPTVVVLLQQTDAGWWQSWGATVFTVLGSVAASLIIALFALRGVKSSAQENAASLIDAETERAKNARDHDDYRWLRGARAKAYFGIIASTHAALQAGTQVVWFGRLKDPSSEKYEAVHPEGMREQVAAWNAASGEALRWAAEVRAVGNARISKLAQRVSRFAGNALNDVLEASKKHSAQEPYDHTKVGKVNNAKAAKNFAKMVALIRQELGSDNAGVPEPASLAASSATPRSGH